MQLVKGEQQNAQYNQSKMLSNLKLSLSTIQSSVFKVSNSLMECPKNNDHTLPKDVCDFLSHIISVALCPFQTAQPPPSVYPPPD